VGIADAFETFIVKKDKTIKSARIISPVEIHYSSETPRDATGAKRQSIKEMNKRLKAGFARIFRMLSFIGES
jgi:hypothetical protein